MFNSQGFNSRSDIESRPKTASNPQNQLNQHQATEMSLASSLQFAGGMDPVKLQNMRPMSQHLKQARIGKNNYLSAAANLPIAKGNVIPQKRLKKVPRPDGAYHAKGNASAQTMDMSKSIHLLSAYGEFDRFVALSKNYMKAKGGKNIEIDLKNQKKLRRKIKRRTHFQERQHSNPISIN